MASNIAPQAPRRSKESGRVGSSFQKQEEIGKGSFATVYKAIHTDAAGAETLVAIKSVNTGKLNKKLKDNLTSEISILKSLHHPHIAALIDCKETTQHIHLIMEYVALGDLSQFIKRRDQIKDSVYVGNMMTKYPNPRVGGLHEVVVRHFLQQLASALQFLRVRNLIHRDVKPQNLLLNPSPDYFAKHKPDPMPYVSSGDALEPVCGIRSLPMLKIADFGFARSLPSTSLAETLCGSPLYMAPEILRYEKYDAKADLWSVGTVLYEMVTAKPPFRAANHVELLRKIEKTSDVIKFGDDILVSDAMKKLIRSLLKRDPKERVSFPDFFDNEIITGAIPGLVAEDLPAEEQSQTRPSDDLGGRESRTEPIDMQRPGRIQEPESPYLGVEQARADALRRRSSAHGHRRVSSIDNKAAASAAPPVRLSSSPQVVADDRLRATSMARPALMPHATAPGRQELIPQSSSPTSSAMTRQGSGGSIKNPSMLRQQLQQAKTDQSDHERTAQDIAFERDYVLVEKRAVEVNALADELEAQPRLNRGTGSLPSQPGAMIRRATTQGVPGSTTGALTTASRAVQIASGRRPESIHQRQSSYERRYGPSPQSAASAISRALNMASGRLFGTSFTPPVNFGLSGRSPPAGYGPFPTYPGAQSSLVVIGGDSRTLPESDDARAISTVEDLATRSDVVFGFAEVKYKQLTPTVPSRTTPGQSNMDDAFADDLTAEALVTVSEEALVLFVKTLSLLAKAMDTAARWWERKKRDGDSGGLVATRHGVMVTASQRMNNVVQWTRGRFNEVLEKTDLVRSKLIESQKKLPEDHPSHPSNITAGTTSSVGLGTSADQVVVTSGVTAEKLMYDRALDMSRTAAINELTGDDLPDCEIRYVTAIRMLEAVLENDEEMLKKTGEIKSSQNSPSGNRAGDGGRIDEDAINGLELENRQAVTTLVKHIHNRLEALRKKLHSMQKRASLPAIGTSKPVSSSSPPVTRALNNSGMHVGSSPQ